MEFIENLLSRFDNANEIIVENSNTGKLFLGDYISALNPSFLLENKITVIINCSPDIPFIDDILELKDLKKYKLKNLEKFRIPVFDSLLEHDINLMTTTLPKVLPFLIKKLINEKKNILIHCHKGAQRSFCVVTALLYVLVKNDISLPEKVIIHKNLNTMKNVIKFIQKKRPCVASYGLRINFRKSLEHFFKSSLI